MRGVSKLRQQCDFFFRVGAQCENATVECAVSVGTVASSIFRPAYGHQRFSLRAGGW